MIEVSQDVDVYCAVRFWISKEKWGALTEEEQERMVDAKIEDAATALQNTLTLEGREGEHTEDYLGCTVDIMRRDKQIPIAIYDDEEGL